MSQEIERLRMFDEIIREIAKEFGLDFFPQEFDVIPAQKMLEIMAYRFPVNFSHWSFGRDYEREKTKHEHGLGVPYEVVLNSNPSRAYLMKTNPFPVQVMVMAHVYAHNDFMKNNRHFGPTRRDILPSASESALRFQDYEKRYGLEEVEKLIDAGMSIEFNINPDFFITEENEEQQRERLTEAPQIETIKRGQFDDLVPPIKEKSMTEEIADSKTPLEPDRDVLLYIINHSPKPLREWEKDVLSVIRDQSRYFIPQRRTKIMNEGWASYWHIKIMDKLFHDGHLNAEEHGYFNLYNARVLATNPRTINPYLIGLKMFRDIEERWNKGQYGREWEECQDPDKHKTWDKAMGQGQEKIFEVRRRFSDRFFIEQYLTEKLVDELNLYIYRGYPGKHEIEYVIKELAWKRIRQMMVAQLSNFDIPLIMIENGDYKGKRQLYLKHAFEEVELDPEYRKKTLEKIFYLWNRSVIISTIIDRKNVLFHYNGEKHKVSDIKY